MTSRQSGWHRPGDAWGSSILGWGTSQLHEQVISPQGAGVPCSGGGRTQHWLAPCMNRREPLRLSALLACDQLLHGRPSLRVGLVPNRPLLAGEVPIV